MPCKINGAQYCAICDAKQHCPSITSVNLLAPSISPVPLPPLTIAHLARQTSLLPAALWNQPDNPSTYDLIYTIICMLDACTHTDVPNTEHDHQFIFEISESIEATKRVAEQLGLLDLEGVGTLMNVLSLASSRLAAKVVGCVRPAVPDSGVTSRLQTEILQTCAEAGQQVPPPLWREEGEATEAAESAQRPLARTAPLDDLAREEAFLEPREVTECGVVYTKLTLPENFTIVSRSPFMPTLTYSRKSSLLAIPASAENSAVEYILYLEDESGPGKNIAPRILEGESRNWLKDAVEARWDSIGYTVQDGEAWKEFIGSDRLILLAGSEPIVGPSGGRFELETGGFALNGVREGVDYPGREHGMTIPEPLTTSHNLMGSKFRAREEDSQTVKTECSQHLQKGKVPSVKGGTSGLTCDNNHDHSSFSDNFKKLYDDLLYQTAETCTNFPFTPCTEAWIQLASLVQMRNSYLEQQIAELQDVNESLTEDVEWHVDVLSRLEDELREAQSDRATAWAKVLDLKDEVERLGKCDGASESERSDERSGYTDMTSSEFIEGSESRFTGFETNSTCKSSYKVVSDNGPLASLLQADPLFQADADARASAFYFFPRTSLVILMTSPLLSYQFSPGSTLPRIHRGLIRHHQSSIEEDPVYQIMNILDFRESLGIQTPNAVQDDVIRIGLPDVDFVSGVGNEVPLAAWEAIDTESCGNEDRWRDWCAVVPCSCCEALDFVHSDEDAERLFGDWSWERGREGERCVSADQPDAASSRGFFGGDKL